MGSMLVGVIGLLCCIFANGHSRLPLIPGVVKSISRSSGSEFSLESGHRWTTGRPLGVTVFLAASRAFSASAIAGAVL